MDAISHPLVISHRTQMGSMPENTLAGIDAALADGVDGIEIDVRATREGVPVLVHDADFARVAGDPREVASLSLDELGGVRITSAFPNVEAQPVPLLAEALAHIDGRAILVIEVKQRGVEEAVARAVRDADAAGWCWIWAFDPAVGRACRKALPEVPVGLNVAPGTLERYGEPGDPVALCVRAGFAAISMAHPLVSAASVREAHRRGLGVYSWTVDADGDIERVWRAGVDAICSNYPTRVDAVIGRTPGVQSW
ncbi:MAG: glycerophosphodiester phosphodiesterase [Chloroflexi bacterium]|nr:glycerophosphodiester phosphodiesterase [Chloroflexota bacterium]MDA1241330.1 glycerophosphodiester phosphodiesterase [Chloroflexota bacterium]